MVDVFMDMKLYLLLALLFIIGCSPGTKVIHYNQQGQVIPEITENAQVNQIKVINQTASTNQSSLNTKDVQSKDDTTKEVTIQTNNQINNSIPEYTITSCCNEGRLYAQTKNNSSIYSDKNVRDILINIYQSHCDDFRNQIRQRVYLKFNGDSEYINLLEHYQDTSINLIMIKNRNTNYTFNVCI